jgi:lipopolysaccharide biosynthesis regulator YciM
MATEDKKSTDRELRHLQKALQANEELMRKAAIKYEDLIAAKEELTAAIQLRKKVRLGAKPPLREKV